MPSDTTSAMPLDPRLPQALAALAQPIAEFRAIVDGALTQADAFLAAQRASAPQRAERAAISLGRFGEGRIDAAGFAALFPPVVTSSPEALAALERALVIVRAVRERGDALFVVNVAPGQRLGAALDDALAAVGRAFGAVVLAEFVRSGRHEPDEERLLQAQPFRLWNKTERRFAPPLVVLVDGADLQAGALMDFADGREKIVLVVRGASPPAPLARCVTPGTFVLQTVDGSGLDRVAAFDGPAVAALVPEGAAVFLHDPAGGKEPWQRMSVKHIPAAPKKALGGQSAWQMAEDLRIVVDLATTPFSVPVAGPGPAAPAVGAADATDKIAAWLLGQAGLQDGMPGGLPGGLPDGLPGGMQGGAA